MQILKDSDLIYVILFIKYENPKMRIFKLVLSVFLVIKFFVLVLAEVDVLNVSI